MDLSFQVCINSNPNATLQPGLEFDPYLKIYLSQDIIPNQCPKKIDSIKQGDIFNVIFQSERCNPVIDLKKACLCIVLYAKVDIKDDVTLISYNYHRASPIGEAVIFLEDLLKTYQYNGSCMLYVRDKTPVQDVDRIVRLLLNIKCTKWKLANNISIVGSHDINEEIKEDERMNALYWKYVRFYETHSATNPAIEPMHIPSWRGQYASVPACMWMFHRPKTKEQIKLCTFLTDRCIDVSLLLCCWNRKEMVEAIEEQFRSKDVTPSIPFLYAIRVLATSVCIIAYACDYIFDLSNGKDTERFKEVVSELLAGDCEDLAFEIFRSCLTILMTDQLILPDEDTIKKDWTAFRKVFFIYISTMLTGSAFNPMMLNRKDDNAKKCITSDELICHIFAGMFPRFEFVNRLNAPDRVKEQIANLMLKELEKQPWEDNLPSIIQEGTNMNCPFMLRQDEYMKDCEVMEMIKQMEDYRQFVESHLPSLSKLNIEMQPYPDNSVPLTNENFSDFYHCINNMWVDLAKYGCNVFDFSVGYDTGARHVYGISAMSWANYKSSSFRFEPVFQIDQTDYEIACNIIEKESPFSPLKVFNGKDSDNKTLRIPKFLLDLEKQYTYPNHMEKDLESKKKARPSLLWYRDFVSYRVNHWNKIIKVPQIIDALQRCLHQGLYSYIKVMEYTISEDASAYIGEIRLYPNQDFVK